MTAIHVEALELARPDGGFRLGPVDLQLESGSRTALVGPSGSGKTTLLRCLAGLDAPQRGSIRFDARIVTERGRNVIDGSARGIGFVFQDGALWPHLDALGHLRFVNPTLAEREALALLDRVGLGAHAERRPAQLSGGEGQRLALARALAGAPKVLLLDEPLGAVDVHLRDDLAMLVRSIALEQGLTLVVVTHDRDEALAMADRLVVLRDGRIVERGASRDLVKQPGTAFTARFLGRAVCLPLWRDEGGTWRSLLTTLTSRDPSGLTHVVLPGDVEVTTAADATRGRVLQCIHDPIGPRRVIVEVDGYGIVALAESDLAEGELVGIRLRGEPRLLPTDVSPSHAADRTGSGGMNP
jgi:iron(III) transport system ATP-binding protein